MGARLRWPVLLAILAIAAWRVPQIPASLGEIHRNLGSVWTDGASWRERLATPGSGEEVLSPPIHAAVRLLRGERIDTYRYSEAIAADPFASQRLVEGAWPIRHEPEAAVVVSYLVESNDCPVIAEQAIAGPPGGVRLARCP